MEVTVLAMPEMVAMVETVVMAVMPLAGAMPEMEETEVTVEMAETLLVSRKSRGSPFAYVLAIGSK